MTKTKAVTKMQALFRANLESIISCEASQRAAAKRLKIHHVLLCGIVRGKRASSGRFQDRVARVYGFQVHELFLPQRDFTALASFVNIGDRLKKH